jgi:hypothetical protein
MTEPKLAKNMSPEEYKAKLAELRRGPPPQPLPVETPTRSAKDMSEHERSEWLANYRRSLKQ